MLAAAFTREEALNFPLLATPKIDGVRALKVNGHLVSRSFKSIPNVAIRRLMEEILPDGADGELSINLDFQETVSAVMSVHGPVPDNLKFYWFDFVQKSGTDIPYERRVHCINMYMKVHGDPVAIIVPLVPEQINSVKELNAYETSVLEQGYEGVVLRAPNGRYKCGRSTVKEGLMIKMKRHEDHEAVIVGTQELMHNMNDGKKDNFGNVKRSSVIKNKVRSGILGAIVAATEDGVVFKIGTGFTNEQRRAFWAIREELAGKIVKYRYSQAYDAPFSISLKHEKEQRPKCAVFMGIRPIEDT